MNLYDEFVEVAKAVEEIYGLPLIIDEDTHNINGYHCPHCGEPVYFVDWEYNYYNELNRLTDCPICEMDLEV